MPARSRVFGLASELGPIVGAENVLTESSALEAFRKDMADFEATPAVVARPSTEEQVGRILDVATRRRVPVVARGAGTSLTGAVVLEGAIILDMQRFNRILKIDPVNWYVQVQAGVVLDDLNQALRKEGFFFPPDPASSFLCTVGGAIAESSGGMRCVRYGTMRDWVLALRVVLANGRTVTLGEPLAKNRVGYDLVHLMIGSEGTLGVVTEAHLKILPVPSVPFVRMLVTFDDWPSAGRAIQELRRRQVMANLMEFMDRETVLAVNAAFQTNFEEAEATLLVDLDEPLVVVAPDRPPRGVPGPRQGSRDAAWASHADIGPCRRRERPSHDPVRSDGLREPGRRDRGLPGSLPLRDPCRRDDHRGTRGRGPEGRPHARTDARARRRRGIAADERDQATVRPEEYPQSGEVRRGRVNQVLGRPFETDQIKRVPNRTPQPVLQLKGAHAALRRDEVASAPAELFE